MSFEIKLRMQMGCGEPLQCRWWITHPTRSLHSGGAGTHGCAVRERQAAVNPRTRCKS
jgi:hypothetical protein